MCPFFSLKPLKGTPLCKGVHSSDLWPLGRPSLSDPLVNHLFFPGSGWEVGGGLDILQVLRTLDIIEITSSQPLFLSTVIKDNFHANNTLL